MYEGEKSFYLDYTVYATTVFNSNQSKLIESTSVDVDKAVSSYRNIQNGVPAVSIVSDKKTHFDTGSSSIASWLAN